MSRYYRLEGKETVPCSLMEWAERFEKGRHVADEWIGGVRISTVFLGLDHNYGDGPPLLFETMVFANDKNHPLDEEMDRYSTWDQAEEGHKAMCERVRKVLS